LRIICTDEKFFFWCGVDCWHRFVESTVLDDTGPKLKCCPIYVETEAESDTITRKKLRLMGRSCNFCWKGLNGECEILRSKGSDRVRIGIVFERPIRIGQR